MGLIKDWVVKEEERKNSGHSMVLTHTRKSATCRPTTLRSKT